MDNRTHRHNSSVNHKPNLSTTFCKCLKFHSISAGIAISTQKNISRNGDQHPEEDAPTAKKINLLIWKNICGTREQHEEEI
jgi:hypothetical protein